MNKFKYINVDILLIKNMSIEKSKKNKKIPLIIEEDEPDNQDIKKKSINFE